MGIPEGRNEPGTSLAVRPPLEFRLYESRIVGEQPVQCGAVILLDCLSCELQLTPSRVYGLDEPLPAGKSAFDGDHESSVFKCELYAKNCCGARYRKTWMSLLDA